MPAPVSPPLATRVRALLRSSEHPSGAAGTASQWRSERDRWLDVLDPRETVELDATAIRSLLDFLSESAPSRSSRRSPVEWSAAVDAVIAELLFTLA